MFLEVDPVAFAVVVDSIAGVDELPRARLPLGVALVGFQLHVEGDHEPPASVHTPEPDRNDHQLEWTPEGPLQTLYGIWAFWYRRSE